MIQVTIKEIINWDVVNWAKALDYWEKNVDLKNKGYNCLELGTANGGLSLWLSLHHNKVLCTDLMEPKEAARNIHQKYHCHPNIEYLAMDATSIPFENHFDIVAFKSILGGISQNGRNEYKLKTLNEIHKALKPGGKLLFAENLEASMLHKILRKNFGTPDWNYVRLDEIEDIFQSYKSVNFTTVGFLGCLGRNETQRNILGRIDGKIEKMIPGKMHYILIGVAEK
ncbi:class I SAM-dependent methyltransferase [Pedobacter gandavensis]|uniref:class I SAM-dependent methyltransferase n=1 Tax=Pedobacter gandavensis TaxID=2679963 RepID=UPI00292D4FB1|nr:class I SAM-dependent methyltransferase [Pedobacter gandavensis]